MKLKTLLIVVALLATLSVVVFLIQRSPEAIAVDPRVGHSLAQGAALEQAVKLRLSDQGKSVTLRRQSDGTWRVTSYFDFPADFKKLSAFVSGVSEATIQRLVTSNPERISRLDFKDTKIEFLDPADKELLAFTLGKNAETGGRYVRLGQEQKAYLTNFAAWLDADEKNWVDHEILNLKPDDIASVEIPFAGGENVKVYRTKKEDIWKSDQTPAGQEVNAAKIASLISSLGTVRFSETTEPHDVTALAARAHERVFKLTAFNGKSYRLALGRKPEDKKLKPAGTALPAPPTTSPEKSMPGEADHQPNAAATEKASAPKPAEPEYETIPAGPVFISIASSDSTAAINTLMQKRAFQIADNTFTALPQKSADLFQPLAPPPAAPAATQPTEDKKVTEAKKE